MGEAMTNKLLVTGCVGCRALTDLPHENAMAAKNQPVVLML
jgi:hypothetical protein